MIFGLPADRLVETRSGSAEKLRLLDQYMIMLARVREAEVTWGSHEHTTLADIMQALREQGYWYDPDVQELLRLQDLNPPALAATARALVERLAEAEADAAGDDDDDDDDIHDHDDHDDDDEEDEPAPLTGAAEPAGALAQRLVEWRPDALPLLTTLMATYVRRVTGVDPLAHPVGQEALTRAAAWMERRCQRDPYWRQVVLEFYNHAGPRLKSLSQWARGHLEIET